MCSTASCVHYVHAIGEWSEPKDLELYGDSLKDVRIKLSCVYSKNTGLITEGEEDSSGIEPCVSIGESLTAAGAVLDHENPEIIVQYKDRDKDEDQCKFGWIPFYFSFTLWPCRATATSYASLVVHRLDTGQTSESAVAIMEQTFMGIGGLALWAFDFRKDPSPDHYRKQLAANFMTFVRNKVYTQAHIKNRSQTSVTREPR